MGKKTEKQAEKTKEKEILSIVIFATRVKSYFREQRDYTEAYLMCHF